MVGCWLVLSRYKVNVANFHQGCITLRRRQWHAASEKVTMACRSCGLENQTQFAGEISIHILGLENVNTPTVWVFPRLLVCMNCGLAEFTIAENELRLLGKGPASDVEAG
jgi:hypothetical protein